MALKRQSGGPTVVLVGRPNVGKSTLFNRITGIAPRDRHRRLPGRPATSLRSRPSGRNVDFTLVDTGGMFGASEDPLHELVVAHGQRAISTADLVVFVVDGREGLVPGDEEIAAQPAQRNVPVHRGGQQDRRQARAGPRGRVLPARLRAGRRDRRRARRGDRRPARRESIARGCRPRARFDGDQLAPTPPRTRPRSPSSAVRTSASRRWSIGCCARSGRSSATCRARRATRSTRC